MKYNRPMNFFEKLQAGWWWTGQIFSEWCYTMTNEEYWEFFNYLQSDYVKYEEDMYYEKGTRRTGTGHSKVPSDAL